MSNKKWCGLVPKTIFTKYGGTYATVKINREACPYLCECIYLYSGKRYYDCQIGACDSGGKLDHDCGQKGDCPIKDVWL